MPRPLRIEYKNAYYYVMNRGRARQKIFHSKVYYEAFLNILEEAHKRFGVEILCYCLMGSHKRKGVRYHVGMFINRGVSVPSVVAKKWVIIG